MLRKLLLTAALLSPTYGADADTKYFDPDFALLANRSAMLEVGTNCVVIDPGTPESCVLRRLTQAEVSDILNSNDFDLLFNTLEESHENIRIIYMIYIALTADSTPNNGISKALDDAFLCQLFWSRVSLTEQLLQAMLLSPRITTDDPTGVLKEHQKKLAVFSKKYDHTDTKLFAKGHYERLTLLIKEVGETSNVQQSTLSTDE
ncbi:hypothetical protein [Candidatus Bodocaedibacter vickermanii]|uniref:Uncharacterized protein n=1 Tax=Candidatus Bodocaedibacter vickermanii TaxID=2741701 RepID=A0A7L9RT09_9PROT|nr:hypothetical protein CPBP_00457 [Candidatus Paracaedibacteraceae bacterium 'Lake Konstanz']